MATRTQDAFYLGREAEIVIATLSVDKRRRIFVSKQAGGVLNILPGDEIVLCRHEGASSIAMKIQREGRIADLFFLTPMNGRFSK